MGTEVKKWNSKGNEAEVEHKKIAGNGGKRLVGGKKKSRGGN